MGTEFIRIVVEERGTRQVQKRIKDIGTTATRSASGVGLLKGAIATLGGALLLRNLARTADAYTNIQNRLRLVTHSTQELNQVTNELHKISNVTRSSFEANAELFNRVSLATRDLGLSQQNVLNFTEKLNKAILISGSTAKEAEAGLIQLSQGMASGALRGDELRSVLEQMPAVADVIAKELAITRGEMREFGAQGKITSEVIVRAFANASDNIDQRFGQIEKTVGQQLQILRNDTVKFVGELNKAFGGSSILNTGLQFLSDNIETLARAIGAAGLTAAIVLATGAMITFTAVMAANPIGAIAVGLTLAVSLLTTFSDKIRVTGDGVTNLQHLAVAAFEVISEEASSLFNEIILSFQFVANALSGTGGGFLQDAFTSTIDFLRNIWNSLFGDLEFTVEGFITGIARTLDLLIAYNRIPIEIIKNLWKGGLDFIGEIAIDLVNLLIRNIEVLLDTTIAAFQQIKNVFNAVKNRDFASFTPKGIVRSFSKELEKAQGNQILPTIENGFRGAGKRLGEAMKQSFIDLFAKTGPAERAVIKIFDRARQKQGVDKPNSAGQLDLGALPAGGPGPRRDGAVADSQSAQLFEQELARLRQEQTLLRMVNQERQIQTDLLGLIDQFKSKEVELSAGQVEQLDTELRRLQLMNQVADALDQVRGETINLAEAQKELNIQLEAGIISLEQGERAFRLLQIQSLQSSRTLEDGFSRGLLKLQEDLSDFASIAEGFFNRTFDSATDSIVKFAETGKFSIKDFANSVIQDMLRIATQQALLGIIGGIFGGPAGLFAGAAAGGSFGGGRAAGGPVSAGRAYVVGEKRPELFVPNTSGRIEKDTSSAQGDSSGNVRIINSVDPEFIQESMNSPEGERIILNVIQRNPTASGMRV